MPSQSLIVVEELSKEYGAFKALKDVSFEMASGEVLGLLGPNGAGKTTLIHILLGLLTKTAGRVSVLGFDPLHQRHELSKKINFSSAYTQLPPNLKVSENLRVYAGIYGVKNPKEKIRKLLETFEMTHLQERLSGALSSGEKTRLNLCKSLLNDPTLLLLDEPTASLDPSMALKVREILMTIQKNTGMGLLYTSHDMAEVEEMCDRVIFVHGGVIRAQGRHEELLKRYHCQSMEEVFIKIVREHD